MAYNNNTIIVWRGTIEKLKDDMCEYEVIKGYHVDNDEIEKETMRYLRIMWNSRQRYKYWESVDWIDCELWEW